MRGPLGTKVWYWNIDYGEYVGIWNHLAITWDGDTTNAPKLYKNASATTATVQSGPNGVTTIYAPERIYLFDDGTTSSSNYELQGSLQDFAIYSGEFSLSTIQTIYNSGVVLDTPHLSANLLDYWKLGNGLNLQVGDSVPASTILSSSFGFKNHLTSSTTVLTAVAGANTESRRTNPNTDPFNNVTEKPRTDLTGSQRTLFQDSLHWRPEIQTIGYLDAYTTTYSVHNALPFRNLSVLGSGSGEQGTIRVEDHLGLRRGLRTLRALHMGKFGIDSQYGSVTAANYPSSGSFNKQHRNRSRAYQYSSGELIITGSNHDNMHINTPIPK